MYKQDNGSKPHCSINISWDSRSEMESLIISFLKRFNMKRQKTVNSLYWLLSVSQLWPLSLWGRAHSELRSVISALIFLWRHSVITDCCTTAWSPLHLLLTALWQLNFQVHELPLVSFWLAGSVRLSCLIPHHVWAVGWAFAAPCHVVGSVGIRNNKQTHQHRL